LPTLYDLAIQRRKNQGCLDPTLTTKPTTVRLHIFAGDHRPSLAYREFDCHVHKTMLLANHFHVKATAHLSEVSALQR
jgi:hypothetical protein